MLKTFSATLSRVEKLTENVHGYEFTIVNDTLEFAAGQYVIMHVPAEDKVLRRLYSIASPTSVKDKFVLIVELLPDGIASKFLMQLPIGSSVTFQAPAGMFVLRSEPNDVNVFIATGTGIAPVLSMLKEESIKDVENFLFWGLPTSRDVYLLQELENVKKNVPKFTYAVCLSREGQPRAPFVAGRVQASLVKLFEQLGASKASRAKFYLCGSHKMVEEVVNMLKERGIPKEHIFHERFTSSTMQELYTHAH